tara:strand:- start:375 stop:902 length:528 start_codon:yes stop_codon:yes gene_type:complete
MDLFSAIGNYIDRGVDWVAEAIGYEDIELPDAVYDAGADVSLTAGDQLIDTVTGFISKAPTPKFSRGYQTRRENPNKFKQRYKQSVSSLSRGSRSLTGAAPRKTPLKVGYLNPDVKADLTNILQNATNNQWRQLFNDYGYVSPTKQISRGSGKTEIKLKTTLKAIDEVELPKSTT